MVPMLTIYLDKMKWQFNSKAVSFTALLLLSVCYYGQRDTSIGVKPNVSVILGTRIFTHYIDVGPKIASNIGFEVKPSNKRYEFFIRNYIYFYHTVKDTTSGLRSSSNPYFVNNSTNFLYYWNSFIGGINFYNKKQNMKYGFGIFYERRENSADKVLFLSTASHFVGIEWSIYKKFKWVNIAFKHQFQLIGQSPAPSRYVKDIGAIDGFRFSLCIEIPIIIKY